jgi:hypothetical protein
MDQGYGGYREGGLINDIRREDGQIDGDIRNVEQNYDQREANQYENRAEYDQQREQQDFNQGRFP